MTTAPGTDARPRTIEYLGLGHLPPAHRNPKQHDLGGLRKAISRFGFTTPVTIDERTGRLVAGHGRCDALAAMFADGEDPPDGIDTAPDGTWLVPVTRGWSSMSDAEADAVLVADNQWTIAGGWDDRQLAEMLEELLDQDPEMLAATGYDPDSIDRMIADMGTPAPESGEGEEWDPDEGSTRAEAAAAEDPAAPRPSLADRFLIPPFDVLDARQGWWQARKKRWLALGIRSEIGRSGRLTHTGDETSDRHFFYKKTAKEKELGRTLTVAEFKADHWDGGHYGRDEEKGLVFGSATGRDPTYYTQKSAAEEATGRKLSGEEFEAEHYVPAASLESGTSIFDPVLCELVYRWFTPPGGRVLDPFAGGSVRGLMAALLGRGYTGNDLSGEQVAANETQAREFVARGLMSTDAAPSWSVGDSGAWVDTLPPGEFDGLLTCPPYLWLEKYSDDPADLSTMSASVFEDAYTHIIDGCARAMRPNSFAVVVVGDVRESKGGGRLVDFRGMTVRAAERAGLSLQTAGVLVTQVGSLAVRAPRTFEATRTLGRTHQDVLVFCKGDRAAAAQACGPVDVSVPDHLLEHMEAE